MEENLDWSYPYLKLPVVTSYLGLGLMAARKAILLQHQDKDGIIHSPCVNPIVDYQWSYGGETYIVKWGKDIYHWGYVYPLQHDTLAVST